jgi:hypothetical protein
VIPVVERDRLVAFVACTVIPVVERDRLVAFVVTGVAGLAGQESCHRQPRRGA